MLWEVLEKSLNFTHTCLYETWTSFHYVLVDIVWVNNTGEESFYDLISDDENVIDMMGQLSACVQGTLY